jgi:SAM-dependent methyltransferase
LAVSSTAETLYALAMPLDSSELEAFYDSRLGQVARRLISRRLRQQWPDLSGQRLLGFGYATPYLRSFAEAERTLAVMPEAQGAIPWGSAGRVQTALIDEQAFPFPDAAFDCLLIVHGLEAVESLRPTLRELWRVLTPAGSLIVIAPNRASLWAQLETSPFGHGQPYTRRQLERLLTQALFLPEAWDSALFMPPFGARRRSIRTGNAWETIGHTMWPRLAGVHIVQASKSLYVPAPVKSARRRVLAPALAGSRSQADMPEHRLIEAQD